MSRNLRVRFNTKYIWIGLDWIHKLKDFIGLGLGKWTNVQPWSTYISLIYRVAGGVSIPDSHDATSPSLFLLSLLPFLPF